MERLYSGAGVVLLWASFNAVLALILGGFTAAGLVGGADHAGALAFSIYAVSVTGVYAIGFLIQFVRSRLRGLKEPPRPASALLAALAVAMAWTGLALGEWASIMAVAVGVTALVFEFYPRTGPVR